MGLAIDRATEIIKWCPTGSSIRHWQWQDEAVASRYVHTKICAHTQTYTHRWTYPHPLSVTGQSVKDMDLSHLSFHRIYFCLRVFLSEEVCAAPGVIISLSRKCVISVTGRVTGWTIKLHRCSAWWAIDKLWQRAEKLRGIVSESLNFILWVNCGFYSSASTRHRQNP